MIKLFAGFKGRKLLLQGLLFLVALTGMSLANASQAAAACGVHTSSSYSFAGLIVESYWWPYGTGQTLESRNTQVYVEAPYDPRPDNDPGNIVHLGSNNTWNSGEIRVDSAVFNQYASGCAPDGYNMVLGYDTTSTRSDGYGGSWALDCDAHAGAGWSVGSERWFTITGVGVPAGARAGGTWEVKSFQAKNGYTGVVTIAYAEPAPPDPAPIGVFDAATCSSIWGWAFDPSDSSQSIQVHVQVDGVVRTSPVNLYLVANQPRPDVNAAYGIGGNHGFSADISAYVGDGGTHTITPYAINIGSAGSTIHSLGTRTVSGCLNYNLTPSVNSASGSTAVVGQAINFTYNMNKTGASPAPSAAVAIKQYVDTPGTTADDFNASTGMQDGVATNCEARYRVGASTACATSWQLPNRVFPSGNTVVTSAGSVPAYTPVNTSSFAPGTRVCQMLAVSPAQQVGTTTIVGRWSAPFCVVIAKKPYLSVINGDVWAGGSFKTASATCAVDTTKSLTGTTTAYPDGSTFGSYAEYGVTSLGPISEFGSAGKPLVGTAVGNNLSFSNTPSIGVFKGTAAGTTHCLADAMDFFGSKGSGTTISGAIDITGYNGIYSTAAGNTGAVTVTAAADPVTLGANRHIVIIVEGDIVINRNIQFANGPYTTLSSIPSLVVISKNGSIRVTQNVTRLDGFFQAKKDFITCAEGGNGGPIGEGNNICKNKLEINGAVSANKLVARRINGAAVVAGVDRRNEAAEVIIMRPDIFLSQYAQAQVDGQLQTVDEDELPPRY